MIHKANKPSACSSPASIDIVVITYITRLNYTKTKQKKKKKRQRKENNYVCVCRVCSELHNLKTAHRILNLWVNAFDLNESLHTIVRVFVNFLFDSFHSFVFVSSLKTAMRNKHEVMNKQIGRFIVIQLNGKYSISTRYFHIVRIHFVLYIYIYKYV